MSTVSREDYERLERELERAYEIQKVTDARLDEMKRLVQHRSSQVIEARRQLRATKKGSR